jgi:hypothetical protein
MNGTYKAVDTGRTPYCRAPDFEPGGWSSPPTRRSMWGLSFRSSNGTGGLSRPEIATNALGMRSWAESTRSVRMFLSGRSGQRVGVGFLGGQEQRM